MLQASRLRPKSHLSCRGALGEFRETFPSETNLMTGSFLSNPPVYFLEHEGPQNASPFLKPKPRREGETLTNLNLWPAMLTGVALNSESLITSSTEKCSWVMLLNLSALWSPKYQFLTPFSSRPFATSSK